MAIKGYRIVVNNKQSHTAHCALAIEILIPETGMANVECCRVKYINGHQTSLDFEQWCNFTT